MRFGRLGREYRQIVFDKALLLQDATSEWVTPGHPLFEAVREDVTERTRDHLRRGAVFYDLHCQAPSRLDELNGRLERRREELQQERQCTIGDIQHIGRAWVLPHPERTSPGIAPMVRDEEIEHAAVAAAIAYEEARGWRAESVEAQNRGFDLISRKPHPEDPQTCIEVRFIEVKGRATVGEIALTSNEYKTAARLKNDYWLYAVFNCAATSEVHAIQDPARLGWEPIVTIEHYHVGAEAILEARTC
jgi:hypothetical protein